MFTSPATFFSQLFTAPDQLDVRQKQRNEALFDSLIKKEKYFQMSKLNEKGK